jgi:hypothetical protein
MSPGLFKKQRKEPEKGPSSENELFPAMPPEPGPGRAPKAVLRPAPLVKWDGPAPEELGIPGRSALFLGPASDEPWRLFRILSGGRKALVQSGIHPARLRARFGLDEAELVWLSAYAGSKEETLAPQTLEYEMLGRLTRHLRARKGAILLLDDVDYLASQCGLEPALRFLKRVADSAAEHKGTLLAIAEAGAFSERERTSLASVFDAVHPVEGGPSGGRIPAALPPGRSSVLIRAGGEAAHRLMEAGTRGRRTLILTPHPPRRLKQGFDFSGAAFLWLSEGAAGEGVLRPQDYAVEGQRAVLRHFRSGPGALAVIDGLEGLRLYGDMPQLVRFVKGASDAAAENGGAVIASLAPGALEPAEEAAVARRFESVLG